MKRFLITFRRQYKAGLTNFIRNSWLTTAATAIMAVTLSFGLFTIMANVTFSQMIEDITSRIDVSVYLKDKIKPVDRERFLAELQSHPDVKEVKYITKDQALQIYREQNKDNLALQNAISQTDNYLPASFQIKTNDPNKIDDIAKTIDQPKNKALQSDPPSYSGKRKLAVDRIVSMARFFRIVGIAGSAIFGIISILIIFNTIRMAIFNRRDEIEIMKLIGATRSYIRGPFLIEASLYGLIAGIFSLVVCYTLLLGQADNLASYMPEVAITQTRDFFKDNAILIGVGTILLGMMIGIISSLLATKRYLKVYTSNGKRRRKA